MTRTYRKSRRAEAQNETRENIVRATMALHVEQGVATTSYPDVAARAGVGAATVYRHFPTPESLVEACGAHFWEMIEPPLPDDAAATFAGLASSPARLKRLVEELDTFYTRAEGPMWSAVRDRDRIPALAGFLAEVGKGICALVAEALEEEPPSDRVKIATALADFTVWRALSATDIGQSRRREILAAIIAVAVKSEATGERAPQRGG